MANAIGGEHSRAHCLCHQTVCSLIYPERPPNSKKSRFLHISSTEPRNSSQTLFIQAIQQTTLVKAVLPFISYVIKG